MTRRSENQYVAKTYGVVMNNPSLVELEHLVNKGRQNWADYRAKHGERALQSYLFLVEQNKGFPVLIKTETATTVELIILQSGSIFSVSTEQFNQYCGAPFVLRPELRDEHPADFERYVQWFDRAYAKLGIKQC